LKKAKFGVSRTQNAAVTELGAGGPSRRGFTLANRVAWQQSRLIEPLIGWMSVKVTRVPVMCRLHLFAVEMRHHATRMMLGRPMRRWILRMAAATAILFVAAMPSSAANLGGSALGKVIRIGPPVAVPLCDGNHQLINNVCVLKPKCPPGTFRGPDGNCVVPACPATTERFNGLCVAKCQPEQHHTQPNGACAS
jgi:hypothetical protein